MGLIQTTLTERKEGKKKHKGKEAKLKENRNFAGKEKVDKALRLITSFIAPKINGRSGPTPTWHMSREPGLFLAHRSIC